MMMHDSQFDTYVTIDGSLRIPDHKPDIKQILQVTSTPMIIRVIVKERKIIFYGEMHIKVNYSTSTQGSSQSACFKVPFANFIEHCHARPSMQAKLGHEIEVQNFFIRDCRLISKFIFLKVCVVDLKESCTIIPRRRAEHNLYPAVKKIDNNSCQSLSKKEDSCSAIICPQCKQPKNKRKSNSNLRNQSKVITRKDSYSREVGDSNARKG